MNTITRETVVVFKHTLDIDSFPTVSKFTPDELKVMLDRMVIELFQLREKEAELNANNAGQATVYLEVR